MVRSLVVMEVSNSWISSKYLEFYHVCLDIQLLQAQKLTAAQDKGVPSLIQLWKSSDF